MHEVLENLLYSKDHEWIELDGAIGTVGISDHAQAELSDVVFVDLPEVGTVIAAGDAVAVVESVKAASDVFSPVSGEVLEVNEELANDPSLINSDPYGAGWLYKIRLDVPGETDDLMNAADYEEYCS
ncbi:MAG: glycine cleavage system protein GcvH [Akkermansia sp.]|nr:glycine cleavage system protein GcvH [Akkermansia sp.]